MSQSAFPVSPNVLVRVFVDGADPQARIYLSTSDVASLHLLRGMRLNENVARVFGKVSKFSRAVISR